MKYPFVIICCFLVFSCAEKEKSHQYTSVKIEKLYSDSISVRAIEIMDGVLGFAANKGVYGTIDFADGKVMTGVQKYDTIIPAFRSIANTSTDFFMLSIANPALLYKTAGNGKMEIVYKEEDSSVFYDAMTFWNDKEGIAIGDSMNGCLSVTITRDGGDTWRKLACSVLPKGVAGEGAFAASDTNIKTIGDKTWVATTSSSIYYSPNKGRTWELFTTPIISAKETQGIYSIDFYDENLGVAIGGDYTEPNSTNANKAITKDGGKTWQLLADGNNPGYKSCIQFIPNSGGKDIVAVGFTGISYSKDMGDSWTSLSKESFYTIRFLNDSIAYAGGKNGIAKLTFK
ncbi:MAG: oxidoreductase [Cellulophaga sp.]